MSTELKTVLDHKKISLSEAEYYRIQNNLKYYESNFEDVNYINTDGVSQTRKFNHLPLGKTVSKKLASLVYNELAEITLDDKRANEFVNDILKNDRFNKNFERYLESGLALGGLAMRPYVDNDTIKIAFIQAPVFVPLQSNAQDVSSAAIVMKSRKDDKYYTLLEFHEWKNGVYRITNELYKSDKKDKVGTRTLLSDLYDDLEETVELRNLSRPLFTYLKPPGMNNRDINSPLGLSIYDNAKTTIDFINQTFDEFAWEVKMGQRRVAVPRQTVRTHFRDDGERVIKSQHFDPNQNIFMQLDGADVNIGIKDLTTDIRSSSYISAINEGLRYFEMQIGVSPGMFTFDGKAMKTATEVVSENSDTYRMRNSIVSIVKHSIAELIVSICELAKAYKLYDGVIPKLDEISVNLDDGVFTDRNNELDYWSKAYATGFIPKTLGIEKILGITEEKAEEVAAQIADEELDRINMTRSQLDVNTYGE